MSAYYFAPAVYHTGSLATQESDTTLAVLHRAGIAGATSVLDVGCGAGQTLRLVERLNTSALLLGIDPDAGACRAGRRAGPRIEFLAGAGERLPLADHSMSHVICRVAINYMHQRSALREMTRVLKPGGKIVLSFIGFGYALREVCHPGKGRWAPRLGNLKDVLAGAALQWLGYQGRRNSFWGRSVPYTACGWLRRGLQKEGCALDWLQCEDRYLCWATVWWAIFSKYE